LFPGLVILTITKRVVKKKKITDKFFVVLFQTFFEFFSKPYTTLFNILNYRYLGGEGLFYNPPPKYLF